MARYREDLAVGEFFSAGSLDSLLQFCSPARSVWSAVESLDFSAFDGRYCNDARGRLAVDPRRIAAVWILAMLRGCTSSVQLAALCKRDIEFRWLLGDAPIEKSTLCAFRRDSADLLSPLSAQVLALLALSGQLPGESVAVDGTIVRAAASLSKVKKRKHIKQKIRKLERLVEAKLAEPEPGEAQSNALEAKAAQLQEALRTMDALGLTHDDDKLTMTEPDASMKKLKGGLGFAPAHNVQLVSDTESGAIIHAEIVDAKNDAGQLAPQLAKADDALEAAGAGPMHEAVADSGYHSSKDLVALDAAGLTTFVPNKRNENRKPKGVTEGFSAGHFHYDETRDTFTCPAGNVLKYRKETEVSKVYQARASDCTTCPFKDQCCPKAKNGRSVNRSKHINLLYTIAERSATDEGRIAAAKRRTTAEGIFARLKEHLHWQRCRLFGRPGAKAELRWRQIAHNILLLKGHWAPLVYTPQNAAHAA